MHIEQKIEREFQNLRDTRANAIAGGSEGLMARLEDNVQMHKYLSGDKLPSVRRIRPLHTD